MKKSNNTRKLFSTLTISTVAITLVACGNEASTEPVQDGVPPEETGTEVEPVEEEEPAEEQEEATVEHNPMNDWLNHGEDLPQEEITILNVIDGSEVLIQNANGEEEVVSLAQLDAPNVDQPLGDISKSYLTDILQEGSTVTLERANPDTDEDGTSLGYFWKGEDGFVNQTILDFGYARHDNSLGHEKYSHIFEEIEPLVQNDGMVIWEVEGYVTEDGFDPSVYE